VVALFAQAGIDIATEQAVADLITYLDKDGDRQLGLIELEKSLRYLKRGEKLPHRIIIKDASKIRIDEATAARVQSKLKAATYGTDPLKFFTKFDKDKVLFLILFFLIFELFLKAFFFSIDFCTHHTQNQCLSLPLSLSLSHTLSLSIYRINRRGAWTVPSS
jgi:hypothetical protein